METWTQDLYSLKIALNQLIYTKNLREREREREREGGGPRFACLPWESSFSLQNTKHKTQHEYAKKNEPCGSKLALAKKLEILKKISKLALAEKLNIFLNVSDFPRSH